MHCLDLVVAPSLFAFPRSFLALLRVRPLLLMLLLVQTSALPRFLLFLLLLLSFGLVLLRSRSWMPKILLILRTLRSSCRLLHLLHKRR